MPEDEDSEAAGLLASLPDDLPLAEMARSCGLDPTRDFRGRNFKGFDFRGADLRGVDFSMCRLQGARFAGAYIEGACFDQAILAQAGLPATELATAADYEKFVSTWKPSSSWPINQGHLPIGATYFVSPGVVRTVSETEVFPPFSQQKSMRQYDLVERVLSYNPNADESLLNRAFVLGVKQHADLGALGGVPPSYRNVDIAGILADLKLDDATISAALAKNINLEDKVTGLELETLLGQEVSSLLADLSKIEHLDHISRAPEVADNFRKLLLAISSDIRVLLIKLAENLDRLRNLEFEPPESSRHYAQDAIEIYAPLAGRIGMQSMREELEELAFKHLHPEVYQVICDRLDALHARNVRLIEEFSIELKSRLSEAGITAQVYGREKKPFAIWRKMQNHQIAMEQISDIYGFRILVDSPAHCYQALAVAHSRWRAVPGRFKDYISTPKQNAYQSLHTTVVGPRHQRIEIQIRTLKMHDIAEAGVAALETSEAPGNETTTVRDNGASAKVHPFVSLRRLIGTLLEDSNPDEFLEHTRLELYRDQVFCYTPKGRIIELPRGATPIDFAYRLHTDIGDSCTAANVNGRQVPLSTQLQNGDLVDIRTSQGHSPPASWEKLAVTANARAAIRRAIRRQTSRIQDVELGRRLISAVAETFSIVYDDQQLRSVLDQFGHGSVEDVLAKVGRGELTPHEVGKAMYPSAF